MDMLRATLKRLLETYVNLMARAQKYSFPAKYNWRWKLDVLRKRYEPETTRVIARELSEGMVFVDIGAHIGYFSRLAAKKVGGSGRVIAFEADRENAALLEKNTAHLPQMTRINEAIADTEGTATFYHVRNSTGCHSLVPNENSESYEVPVTSLDEYLAKNSVAKVDMIKMDIEGGEWKALQGMEKTLQIPGLILIFEYNPEALTRASIAPAEILRHLDSRGFSISSLTIHGKEVLLPTHFDTFDATITPGGSINLYCAKIGA